MVKSLDGIHPNVNPCGTFPLFSVDGIIVVNVQYTTDGPPL
jgi:hypothetical protein